MNKEQIEEMTVTTCMLYRGYLDKKCAGSGDCNFNCHQYERCKKLYEKGYRKQSEGEWVDQYQGKYVNQLYKCSVCGDTAFHDDKRWFLTPYCHNCGAKMKGGAALPEVVKG